MSSSADLDAVPSKGGHMPANWTTMVVMCLAMLTGGGGVGSALTGQAVSSEVSELRSDLSTQNAEVSGKLDVLTTKIDQSNRQLIDLEKRLRAVERTQQQIDDLLRRVNALESDGVRVR